MHTKVFNYSITIPTSYIQYVISFRSESKSLHVYQLVFEIMRVPVVSMSRQGMQIIAHKCTIKKRIKFEYVDFFFFGYVD